MRPLCVVLFFAFAGAHVAVAQMPPPSQQTARQALIEMFTGNAQTLERHLPDGARKILQGGGAGSPFLPALSNFSAGLAASRDHIQISDAGSLLLSIEEDDGHKKMEVIVERDDLYGDADDIELSFHSYADGLPEPLPVLPRLTFSMTQEREIWKLNEIALTLRVPLNDPECLSGLQEKQNKSLESTAASNLRTVNTAEIIRGQLPRSGIYLQARRARRRGRPAQSATCPADRREPGERPEKRLHLVDRWLRCPTCFGVSRYGHSHQPRIWHASILYGRVRGCPVRR